MTAVRTKLQLGLWMAVLLTACGGSAATPTPALDLPRESRVLTPAEQEAWLAEARDREAICAPLMPVLGPDGLECWEPTDDWEPGGYFED